jgi:hypothetical protein
MLNYQRVLLKVMVEVSQTWDFVGFAGKWGVEVVNQLITW